MSVIAYIALGSNLHNPEKQVCDAAQAIQRLPSTEFITQSSLYKTPPLGPHNQPDYINQVIAIKTALSADELLDALLTLEKTMGRVRDVRWGPRIIDCDIILFGDHVIQSDHLTVPHPEMKNRTFVLRPLAEIAPDLVLPSGETVQQLLDALYVT